jgi:hypothetical protein
MNDLVYHIEFISCFVLWFRKEILTDQYRNYAA